MSDEKLLEQSAAQLAPSRHRMILEALERAEEVKITTLVADLGVSAETIRRDLRTLEGTGRLKRVHGGAMAVRGVDVPSYEERATTLVDEKRSIAACIAELGLSGKGKRIFLGGGSTMMAVAQVFAHGEPATFITNAIDVAALLNRTGKHDVELTGGQLIKNYELLTGSPVYEHARRYRYDLAITSTNGIDRNLGFLEYFASEAELHRVLAAHAHTYVVVADHTKFGAVADHIAFGAAAIDTLVTDRRPPRTFEEAFEAADVRVCWPPEPAVHEEK